MATIPSQVFPTWATAALGIARTVYPGATRQGDGWDVSEEPPNTWFNWWKNSTGAWLQYTRLLTTEVRNSFGLESPGNHVLFGLEPGFVTPTVTTSAGAAVLFKTTPATDEPKYAPTYAGVLTLNISTAVAAPVNTWSSVFAERHATTGALQLVVSIGTTTAWPAPGAEQVLIALYHNGTGVLYDAREFVLRSLRNSPVISAEANYVSNLVTIKDPDIIKIRSHVRTSANGLGSYAIDYLCNLEIVAAQHASFLDTLAGFTASTNYYLYLAKSRGQFTPGSHTDGSISPVSTTGNCFPVLSLTAPTSGRMISFTGAEAGLVSRGLGMAADGVIIGVLRRNVGNTAWEHWTTSGNETSFVGNRQLFATNPAGAATLVHTGTTAVSLTGVPTAREYGYVCSGQVFSTLATSWSFDIALTGSAGLHLRHLAHNVAGFAIGIYSPESELYWAPNAVSMTYTSTTVQLADHLATTRIASIRF